MQAMYLLRLLLNTSAWLWIRKEQNQKSAIASAL
jgi:hypothetical protein